MQAIVMKTGRGCGMWRVVDVVAHSLPSWQHYAVVGPDGLPFSIDLRNGGFGLLTQGWGVEHMNAVIATIPEDGVAIDIGANVGCVTRLLCRSLQRGHVYAFEPAPESFRLLTRNASAYPNATCVPSAVGSTSDCVAFSGPTMRGNLRHICDPGLPGTERVPCMTLSDWCREQAIARLDFIKIDVEGCEEDVLLPSRDVLERWRPVMVFEFIPELARQRSRFAGEQLFPALKELGYSIRRLDKAGNDGALNEARDWTNDYLALPAP
jgi:FkbM family methyltransferase